MIARLQRLLLAKGWLETNSTVDYRAVSLGSSLYRSCGVRAAIETASTTMNTRVQVICWVVDEEAFSATDGGLRFACIGRGGKPLPYSSDTPCAAIPFIYNKDQLGASILLDTREMMQDKIILRGFNVIDDKRYETHLFKMIRKQP